MTGPDGVPRRVDANDIELIRTALVNNNRVPRGGVVDGETLHGSRRRAKRNEWTESVDENGDRETAYPDRGL
jgi:hypothetical protein